jgi:hypothetical protein
MCNQLHKMGADWRHDRMKRLAFLLDGTWQSLAGLPTNVVLAAAGVLRPNNWESGDRGNRKGHASRRVCSSDVSIIK